VPQRDPRCLPNPGPPGAPCPTARRLRAGRRRARRPHRPLSAADDMLARLDERLRKSPVCPGVLARADAAEACAALWARAPSCLSRTSFSMSPGWTSAAPPMTSSGARLSAPAPQGGSRRSENPADASWDFGADRRAAAVSAAPAVSPRECPRACPRKCPRARAGGRGGGRRQESGPGAWRDPRSPGRRGEITEAPPAAEPETCAAPPARQGPRPSRGAAQRPIRL